nr:ABC transporter ATP-binding protein [uncultured bacterium]
MNAARWSPLLQLLSTSRLDRRIIWMLALSALSNAALLATINAAADNAANALANTRMMVLFAIIVVVFLRTQRYVLLTSISEVERILDAIRLRISRLVARSDLRRLELVGRARIYGSLHRETVTISQAASTLVVACQSAMMVVFSLIYLGWLSRGALALMLIAIVVSVRVHYKRVMQSSRLLHEAQHTENEFFDAFTHMLEGFKEVKLNRARAESLTGQLAAISTRLRDVKVRSAASFALQFLYGQLSVYLLLGAIVFLLPRLAAEYTDVVTKATASILFIVGPLTNLFSTMPYFSAANVAAEAIVELEQQLEAATEPPSDERRPAASAPPTIDMRGVRFSFADSAGHPTFTVGPIDLTIPSAEVLFIVGGNGSGKSTFLKLLTGLYPPDEGLISLGGITLNAATAVWYRSHFAAVLSDYHLFDRLYGVEDVDVEQVNDLLTMFEIESKTGLEDGRFTTLDLSAGQKKRIALAVALLEDRPILVLDEWAADQDPEFRRYFYETLIPRLKGEGRTIVAATHDDRYFSAADRVLKMEDGRFTDLKT